MSDSTTRRRRRKTKANLPPKPYKDFPLTPHSLGYWCKSIKGQVRYFGRWGKQVKGKMERLPGDGWQAALDQYIEQKDDLQAGREPGQSEKGDALTVAALCDKYLEHKQALETTGEITPRTYQGYVQITNRLRNVLGSIRVGSITPTHLGKLRAAMAKTLGPVALGNQIQGIRSVFKFAYDEELISEPVRYGRQFDKPTKKTLRKNRAEKGKRMFEAEQLREIIKASPTQLRAMFMLAINCGFGNTDCSTLPLSAVDLDKGWIDFPRVKTGVERRCPLWPETVIALNEVIASRPTPKDDRDADLVFITKYGHPWVKTREGSSDDSVAKESAKLLKELNLHRPGLGFYAARHTFQTIGEEAGETATRYLMGHTDDSMSAAYRERIGDDRLKAVTEHVHQWLFSENGTHHTEQTEPVKLRIVG